MRGVVLCLLVCACGNQAMLSEGGMHGDVRNVDSGNAMANDTSDVQAMGAEGYVQYEDKFNQSQKGVLDILLVIDNSGSMQNSQYRLKQNLPALLQYVSASDWQIAVIGTKINNCLSERITKHMSNFEDKYKQLIDLGAHGNGEYYFYKAIHGLKGECNGTTKSWLRNNSTVAILIVGDQHNECHGHHDGDDSGSLPSDALCASSDLTAHLNSIRSSGNAKVYGIVSSSAFNRYSNELSIFADYGAISDTSYAGTLEKISQNVQEVLEDVFMLSQVPSGEVKVVVNGNALASSKYTIDAQGKQLKFDQGYVPPEKASIVATYNSLVE